MSDAVRTALVALADAYSADSADRLEDLEAVLYRALDEPGREPPDWEVLRRIGETALRRPSGQPEAFEAFVRAVVSAPTEPQRDLALQALQLLSGEGNTECARGVPAETLEQLRDEAKSAGRQEGAYDEIASLLARILLLRGSVHMAQEVALGSSLPTVEADPLLGELSASSRVADLLLAGRVDEAEEWLDRQTPTSPDSPLLALRAWCSYARGDLAATIQLSSASTRNAELAMTEALALLRQAADMGDDGTLTNQAVIAAGRAARLERSRAEVFLVRAQVLLEHDVDLAEGRSLLQKGLGLLSEVSTAIYWWPLQQEARHNEHFAYFELECAAMLGDHQQVLEKSNGLFGTALRTHQDGAIIQLRASSLAATGALADAAFAFGEAARHHQAAGDAVSQLECLREQLTPEPSGPAATDLAEALWAGTLEMTDPVSAGPVLDEACAVLDDNTATIPADTVGRANVVLG
jgi:hypothetical protein